MKNKFSSNSLKFRILDDKDISDEYVRWMNDPMVNKYLESRFQSYNKEILSSYVKSMNENKDSFLFGIFNKDNSNEHIGNIKIEVNLHHKVGEIGLIIGNKDFWGKGIATESIIAVSKFAKEELNLRKLTAGCYGSNKGSKKAFIKAGFLEESVRADHFIVDNGFDDLVLLGKFIK